MDHQVENSKTLAETVLYAHARFRFDARHRDNRGLCGVRNAQPEYADDS